MSNQDKYTRSARGKLCQIRIPGYCTGGGEDTVFAHLNGGGMGGKHANIHGAYGCFACHQIVDGVTRTAYTPKVISLWHHEGVIRTQRIMIDEGVLEL